VTGWYSKDAILAQALGYTVVHKQHGLLFLLPLMTAGITAFYMSRMWFMTFTGEPRDAAVYEHAHESPRTMTVPLVILAVFSIGAAWGWPWYDAKASWLEHNVHHAQPAAVLADFGHVLDEGEAWEVTRSEFANERLQAYRWHDTSGALALGLVGVGIVFAAAVYFWRLVDAEEGKAQFARLHAFLQDKWGFDWLYSVTLVRPALVVAGWCRAFDLYVIDGLINGLGWLTVAVARWDGHFDNRVVDGLVNLVGDVIWASGARLRRVQTGFLRSYILFLALAAVSLFLLLSYLVAMASAR
jgi:NADH-quinone oxidoreductase subunit L